VNDTIRERVVELIAAVPLAFVLSILMRAFAGAFHIETPGELFLDWYVPGWSGLAILGGPALIYERTVDLLFCVLLLLGFYWIIQRRFYGAKD
jgi:hypothetical protein